ncbi:MAG: hypothetical protein ACE5JB_02040 [bacterium]
MEFLQDIRWILVAAGVLLVVASIFGGGLEIKEIKIPQLHKGARILSAVVGIGFLVLGLRQATDETGRAIEDFKITIDNPQQGTEVSPEILADGRLRITLRGTLNPPVHTGVLWIISKNVDQEHYVENKLLPAPKKDWEESLVFGPAWKGQVAKILIIKTKKALDSDVKTGEPTTLPSDAKTLAETSFKIIDPLKAIK